MHAINFIRIARPIPGKSSGRGVIRLRKCRKQPEDGCSYNGDAGEKEEESNDLGLLLQHLDPTNLSSNTKAA